MKMELSFLLTILLWIYQVSTDNHFSVQTTCTPQHNWPNEIEINCTVCGFSDLDFLKFEVEWLLQKNLSITSPARITPGNVRGNFSKYTWEFITVNDDDCGGNKTVFKLVVQEPTSTSFGIYTCYVTLNGSITKQSSVDLSSGNENASPNYVLMSVSNVPVADIAKSCKKYGYDVFMDDSVAKSVPLRDPESAYFPVCPSIKINNGSTAACNPWISRIGCYNITVEILNNHTEMDCRNIDITKWGKSLPLIGNTTRSSCYLLDGNVKDENLRVSDTYCAGAGSDDSYHDNRTEFLTLFSIIDIDTTTLTDDTKSECVATHKNFESSQIFEHRCDEHCDTYCIQDDEVNLSFKGFKAWEDARENCRSLNSSLPNENFQISDPTQVQNKTAVCLSVFKSSSVSFQPVIKLARNENGTITIHDSIRETRQYLCGRKIEKSNSGENSTCIVTFDFNISHERGTTTESSEFTRKTQPEQDNLTCVIHHEIVHLKYKKTNTLHPALWTYKSPGFKPYTSSSRTYMYGHSDDIRFPIIITSSVVGVLLIVMIFACFITRVIKRKGNREKSSTTEEIVTSDLYSEPIPASGENIMKTKNHITAEDESAYSVADTNDNEYSQPLVNRDNRTGQVRSAKDVTSSDSEYADTDLGEYDVLRGQRKKQSENTSSNCDIYDRTNNAVTGIYDVTSNTLNENEYSLTDNDLNQ